MPVLVALRDGLIVLPDTRLVPLEASPSPSGIRLSVGEVCLSLVVHLPQRLDLLVLLRVELLPDLPQEGLELVEDLTLRLRNGHEWVVGRDVVADHPCVVGAETDVLSAEYLLLP